MNKIAKVAMISSMLFAGILLTVFVLAAPKACNNGNDDDGDGLIDLADPGCRNKGDRTETNPNLVCDDGIDNDGDTFTDSADPGCSSPTDSSELGTVECDDGSDNGDTDVLADYPNDPGCSSPSDNNEVDGQCDDGSDNDGDGHNDLSDSECSGTADNDESPRDFCSGDGYDVETQGSISGEDDSSAFAHTDTCLDSSTIREYYCGGLGSDYDPLHQDVACNNGTGVCSDGACVEDLFPIATADADVTSGYEPLEVDFDGSVASGNAPFDYSWDFDDTTGSLLEDPTHTFSGGTYDVSFTVTDDDGDDDTDNIAITVDYCGDNEKNGPEFCDGTDLNGQTCAGLGFDGGVLGCAETCDAYDTSNCFDNTCSDSDGGIVPTIAGEVSGETGGNPFSYEDICDDSVNLIEWYCNGNFPDVSNSSCITNGTTNCVSGACV